MSDIVVKSGDDWVKLNVGGIIFETTKQTLSQASYFISLFGGQWTNQTHDGVYRIDRSGQIFEEVLRLLRNPNYDYPSRQGYIDELDFYGIKHNFIAMPDVQETLIAEIIRIKRKNEMCSMIGCPFYGVIDCSGPTDKKLEYCVYCLPGARDKLMKYFPRMRQGTPIFIIKHKDTLHAVNTCNNRSSDDTKLQYFLYYYKYSPKRTLGERRREFLLNEITLPTYQEAFEFLRNFESD